MCLIVLIIKIVYIISVNLQFKTEITHGFLNFCTCKKNGRSDLNCKKQHQLRCTAIWDCQNLSSQLCGLSTGKSFSEALILASVIPQYDKILFIEFPEKHVMHKKCFVFVLIFKIIFVHNLFFN